MTLSEKVRHSADRVISAVRGLSPEVLLQRPAEGKWNITECLEHIYLVNANVLRILQTPAERTNPNKATENFSEGKLQHILVTKRLEMKVQAPEFVTPTGKHGSAAELELLLRDLAAKTSALLETTDISGETGTLQHPRLGEMTKTDWVHFLLAHTERHLHQIEELKSVKPTNA